MKYYAGVGSRTTPPEILATMTKAAGILEQQGYILRSGKAKGADRAFEAGVKSSLNKQIFPNWYPTSEEAKKIAASIHPAWGNCSEYAKACHARNVYQILGENLNSPVEFVICWTPDAQPIGGTRTAIILAKKHKIPVFNLAAPERNDFPHLQLPFLL